MIKHEPILELEELKLTKSAKGFLKEIAKWSKFLSILGFVGITFLMVYAIFYKSILERIGEPTVQDGFETALVISLVYVFFAIVLFFPNYYLFQFSKKMKIALAKKDDDMLSKSFELLKSNFKFYGVFIIIMISVNLVVTAFVTFGLVV